MGLEEKEFKDELGRTIGQGASHLGRGFLPARFFGGKK
jgi:hypothetical protein